MRRLISVFIVLVMVFSVGASYASENPDYKSYTDEELQSTLSAIGNELESRSYSVDINVVKKDKLNFDPQNPPIEIYKIRVEDINSAGGVEVGIYWKNISDKKMKYVIFEVVPYNQVNDMVYSDVGNISKTNLKITGPIFPYTPNCHYSTLSSDYEGGSLWENVWYNNTVSKIKLVSVTITYMDDTTLVVDENNTSYLLTVKLPK